MKPRKQEERACRTLSPPFLSNPLTQSQLHLSRLPPPLGGCLLFPSRLVLQRHQVADVAETCCPGRQRTQCWTGGRTMGEHHKVSAAPDMARYGVLHIAPRENQVP
jgi:hypothetical protein